MKHEDTEVLEALRSSLTAVDRLRRENAALVDAAREPIAIVAMSCRLPGDVQSPEALWSVLADARDLISPFPSNRGWDTSAIYDPDPEAAGKTYTREGGFLHDADLFDPAFFAITPREALAVDPQQRLLLETSWELLERAGIVPTSLQGSQVGVFVGVIYNDYFSRLRSAPSDLEAYVGVGSSASVASGRIAYTFGFHGPTVTVDTACSSSLVAIHLAGQALRQRECSLALAGGVTVMASPAPFIGLSRQHAASPDGRCKAFSADADGAGWSEGAAMLLLERLSDAKRHGRRVLAVLRGSAVNQDGKSQGLTAPNGPAQERVIRQALESARLSAQEIDAVEAHGTGTALGDPIEAHALLATYGRPHSRDRPLWLGSLKSNLGHTQAAAGVAGVIKMVLAMQHGLLPKTLHAETPSPHIDWSSGNVRLLTEPVPWLESDRPRRAGISSFGVSGTNAHVIVEEAPVHETTGDASPPPPVDLPVLLSAKSEIALRAQAERLRAHLVEHPDLTLHDVAYSLATTRSHFEQRAALVVDSRDKLIDRLASLARGESTANLAVGQTIRSGKLVFVFPGQGTQWEGMGRALLETSPPFREQVEACERAFVAHIEWSLLDVLRGVDGAPRFDRLDVLQPCLFAIMLGLTAHWRSLGIQPDAVVGHSQGEIAAAYVAGALSLEDAAKIVALRSRSLVSLVGKGAMAAVQSPLAEVASLLAPFGNRISVAAVNSPVSVTIAGEASAVETLLRELESRRVPAQMLPIDVATHCEHIGDVREQLLTDLRDVRPHTAKLPLYSTVTATKLEGTELDAEHWYRNIREPVRFADVTKRILDDGHTFFIEVSPHPVLSAAVNESAEALDRTIATIASLRRTRGTVGRLLLALGELHARGYPVDWPAFFAPLGARHAPLPTYAFQRRRFWLDEGTTRNADLASAGLSSAEHPLLGAAVALADTDGFLFTTRLSLSTHPWLSGHAAFGHVIVPGTAFVECALVAARHVRLDRIDELTIEAPLLVPPSSAVRVQLSVGAPDDAGRRSFAVHGRDELLGDDASWSRFASGTLAPARSDEPRSFDLAEWPPKDATAVVLDGLYDRLREAGLAYGPAFQGLRSIYAREGDLFAEVVLPESVVKDAPDYLLHPALFDAVLHALAFDGVHGRRDVALPFSWSGVTLYATGASTLRVHVRRDRDGGGFALDLADAAGRPVAHVDALSARPVSASQLVKNDAHGALLKLVWTPVAPRPLEPNATDERWLVLGSDHQRLLTALRTSAPHLDHFPDIDAWKGALDGGAPSTHTVVVPLERSRESHHLVAAAHHATERALSLLQSWLADERCASSRLILLTHYAVATDDDRELTDLVHAPLWGLVRSAQAEHPEAAIFLVDVDDADLSYRAIAPAITIAMESAERQLALRQGRAFVPRLAAANALATLAFPPATEVWHLDVPNQGSLDDLALRPRADISAPLAAGLVKVAVHAAGLNFRDVLQVLAMYPGEATLGAEGAGVVVDVGPGVTAFRPGDRVMGLLYRAFGPVAVTDERLLTRIPAHWPFTDAASIPVVFLTAYYCLVDVARLKPGERILIHAAAGGVGMAATQMARHLGAEVFATASVAKWETLRALGFDDAHIASSRSVEFEHRFLHATGGAGVDVVLNCLAHELVDASLRLLPRGGRFVEMGKTDLRDPTTIAALHPGVVYRAFDLTTEEESHTQERLSDLARLFEEGVLRPLPTTVHDVRNAPRAFRALAQARVTGKIVLTIPRPLHPSGTVLITGGTGTLGAMLARHLVRTHGVERLLLASRQGPRAEGALALKADIEADGAHVVLAACDVADRSQLEELLATISSEHPLTAVVHTAGALDDGLFTDLTPERLHSVLRAKLDAAVHLHELTEGLDLAAFVLYSSVSGVFGGPGQANYAAANAFLDALAHHRSARGLPALSLDWGYWRSKSALSAHLSAADLKRFARSGLKPISDAEGLALFDAAIARPESSIVAAPLDTTFLAKHADALPPLLRGLVRGRALPIATGAKAASSLVQRLSSLSETERSAATLDVVRTHAAHVLGMKASAIEPSQPLKDLGLDSLMAVEIRNRLGAATGLRLRATLLFDHPTPDALARFLIAALLGSEPRTSTERSRRVPSTEAGDDPVAIVAMSCRFPGGVDGPEDLWCLLSEERDVISAFPTNRGWKSEDIYDPDPDAAGKSYAREGGFLHDADLFDPTFFAITPREALTVDPQQRLLLETSWEAFERAGIDPASLQGSPTGVFVGVVYNDYASRIRHAPDDLEGYLGLGSLPSIASGRIAYTFGLHGPTVTVDTACSSSLVAIHLARQALRHGECDLALAGGVTVMATPGAFVVFSRQRAMSPDGRCKSFSADANGAGWSEGAGMLLLERLSDAKRNGRSVLAILRGSAVNQDGRSQGLTAPNGPAQERVIRQALEAARLSPQDVDVVEAHGTGTTLGDTIEANALLSTYGQARADRPPLWLGSLKSNIGHAQAAAGVGGIIKMVLAMQHGVLPKTLHAERPSEHVDWTTGHIRLLNEPAAWPESGHPRRAAVSAFGISGTNAHAILERAPSPEIVADVSRPREEAVLPFLISAKTETALRAQAERLREHLRARPDLELVDVAASLATSRAHFEHRAALVVHGRDALIDTLDSIAQGRPATDTFVGRATTRGRMVFVFPGQGTQWEGMARALLASSTAFRDQLEACDRAFASYVDWSLLEVLRGSSGAPSFERLDVLQPTLFAVMVGLAAHWRSVGIEPDAVVGHSQGEIAAAYVAGALTLDDAARIVILRSRALTPFIGLGAMAAVQAPVAELEPHLAPFRDSISVAAVNSPASTTVAGVLASVEALLRDLEAKQISTRLLRIDFASHCSLVDPVRDRLLVDLADLRPRVGPVAFYSTVTTSKLEATKLDADYWYRNVREPVRFADTARRLLDDGHTFFLEVSPHPALAIALNEVAESLDRGAVVVGSLRRNDGGSDRLLRSLGELHAHGYPVDWKAFVEPFVPRRVPLPTYAFQRERFWLDAGAPRSADVGSAGLVSLRHPMLGAAIAIAERDEVLFTARVALSDHPWLAGHAVFDTVLLPGTAFLEFAFVAAEHVGLERIDELTLEAPLLLSSSSAVCVQLSVGPTDDTGRRPFTFHGREEHVDDGPWTRLASGILAPATSTNLPSVALDVWPPPGAIPVGIDGLYSRLGEAGLTYGPEFQGLRAVYRRGDELFAEVAPPNGVAKDAGYALHPALFDAALHALLVEDVRPSTELSLPFSWSGVTLHAACASSLRVRIHRSPTDGSIAVDLADPSGRPVARADTLIARPVSPEQLTQRDVGRGLLHLEWVPGSTPDSATPETIDEHWVVLGDHVELASALRSAVRQLDQAPNLDAWMTTFDQGGARPDAVVVPLTATDDGRNLIATAHRATEHVLTLLQAWLADDRFASMRLILLSQRAVAATGEDDVDLVHAPTWGLVRSAQNENPHQSITLVDSDDTDASRRALVSVILANTAENQLALRRGHAFVPRLVKVRPSPHAPRRLDPNGTVLITGGTGTLGTFLARHLASVHGVKHLLLTSRQGPRAEGALALTNDLEAIGAHVTIAACDVTARAELEALLAAVPKKHPLTAVIHTAGSVDDGLFSTLTPDRLHPVLRTKLDAAVHLHELTESLDLSAFVLFSSLAGVVGSPGQANYAAANAFLDALATRRKAGGLPALSLDWGFWQDRSALTRDLSEADVRRVTGSGFRPITKEDGLALFDAAFVRPESVLVAAPFDAPVTRRTGSVPAIFRALVRPRASRPNAVDRPDPSSLERRLLPLSAAERHSAILDLVRSHVAVVTGMEATAIDPNRPVEQLGLDSLMAVEIRNRLAAATGLRLRPTLLFNHRTFASLASTLVAGLTPESVPRPPVPDAPPRDHLQKMEGILASFRSQETRRRELTRRLHARVTASDTSPEVDDTSLLVDEIEQTFDPNLVVELRACVADLSRQAPSSRSIQTARARELEIATAEARSELRAELDGIVPASAHALGWCNERPILLTGATGFLGAYLLQELLERTEREILVLVRAKSIDEALQRVASNLGQYGLTASLRSRVRPVLADLAAPNCGMTDTVVDDLAHRAGLVLHAAALVHHGYPYDVLKPSNVTPLIRLLGVAARGQPKPTAFISSTSVFAMTSDQGAELDDGDMGYIRSKVVCERLLPMARGRGLPARVFRPSLIVGTATSPIRAGYEHLGVILLRSIVKSGVYPSSPVEIDAIQVDTAARAVVALTTRDDVVSEEFNLTARCRLSTDDLAAAIRQAGYGVRPLAPHLWLRRAEQVEPLLSIYGPWLLGGSPTVATESTTSEMERIPLSLVDSISPDVHRTQLEHCLRTKQIPPPGDSSDAQLGERR